MENEKQKKILFALIPIVIALLSFFVIARFTSSTEFNAKTIQSLDDKKTTVMECRSIYSGISSDHIDSGGCRNSNCMCIFLRVSVVEERDIASGRTEIPAFRTGSVSCDPGEREGGGYDRDNLCVIHREYDRDCEADNR